MTTRLLVLDDDLIIGALFKRITQLSGFEAHHTDQPDEFFTMVEQWRPSHVAIDLMMPDMDGVEVIERLARLKVSANIIVTSGLGSRVLDAAARSAEQHGLHLLGVLKKPFKPADLRALLNKTANSVTVRQQPIHDIGKHDIAKAIEAHEFSLMYQPKVSCIDESVSGFEVLSRWKHPELGYIPPDYFIGKAEEFDLIDQLTWQIVERALQDFATELMCHENKLTLSINLSGKTLSNSKLIDVFSDACRRYGISEDKIILELTETAAMSSPVQSLALLTRLRLKKYGLSIDDFGTGFSSMLQLVKLPFSEIKIDKSFVLTALKDEESRAVIRATIDLAKSLGLSSVAEGVEDRDTFELLRELGCDTVQGYYFFKPLLLCEAKRLIDKKA